MICFPAEKSPFCYFKKQIYRKKNWNLPCILEQEQISEFEKWNSAYIIIQGSKLNETSVNHFFFFNHRLLDEVNSTQAGKKTIEISLGSNTDFMLDIRMDLVELKTPIEYPKLKDKELSEFCKRIFNVYGWVIKFHFYELTLIKLHIFELSMWRIVG